MLGSDLFANFVIGISATGVMGLNLQDLIDSNHSVLGSFGEFVYGKICEQEQVDFEVSHILETDFRVNCRGKLFEVDVKTTRPHTSFAKAKKYPKKNKSICYELHLLMYLILWKHIAIWHNSIKSGTLRRNNRERTREGPLNFSKLSNVIPSSCLLKKQNP